jgi:hypothetical protein
MIARNDGIFTVAGFRIPVERCEQAHKASPEFLELREQFRAKVSELSVQYPPDKTKHQCPTILVSSL